MTEEDKQVERQPDGKFPVGTSGNPVGRPKGSKNKVTLLKLMAEEAARERNSEKMQQVMDAIVEDALEGDKDMRKLVWQAVMSKGSVDDRSQAQERVEININAMQAEPEKSVTIDQVDEEDANDGSTTE